MKKFFVRLSVFVTFTAAAYIMINGLGLSDSLDFGAGAYYYADMPGFEKWFDRVFYVPQIPAAVIFSLFFIWGAVVYRLWLKIDRRIEK